MCWNEYLGGAIFIQLEAMSRYARDHWHNCQGLIMQAGAAWIPNQAESLRAVRGPVVARHTTSRSSETIHSLRGQIDCFASLAMTG
jgi:hypothetical protein